MLRSSSRRVWWAVAAWTLCVLAAFAVAVHLWPWAEDGAFWQTVGAFGNSGLAILCLGATFFFVDRAMHGDAVSLWGVVGLFLLAGAHAMLPVSVGTGLVPAELVLPIGRGLRAGGVALMLPWVIVELARVRPRRG